MVLLSTTSTQQLNNKINENNTKIINQINKDVDIKIDNSKTNIINTVNTNIDKINANNTVINANIDNSIKQNNVEINKTIKK